MIKFVGIFSVGNLLIVLCAFALAGIAAILWGLPGFVIAILAAAILLAFR
jgi:hypothetical protein